jgi:hypothetical protein
MGRSGTDGGSTASRQTAATFPPVPKTPPALAVWRGLPSGEVFADLVRDRAERSGVTPHVVVTAWELQGAYGVTVDWTSGDAMYEVADWVAGARVLDTGDDLSLDQALDYLTARVSGLRPEEGPSGSASISLTMGEASATKALTRRCPIVGRLGSSPQTRSEGPFRDGAARPNGSGRLPPADWWSLTATPAGS